MTPTQMDAELEERLLIARKLSAGSRLMGNTVDRFCEIHNAQQARLASGLVTEAQYIEQARVLFNLIGDPGENLTRIANAM